MTNKNIPNELILGHNFIFYNDFRDWDTRIYYKCSECNLELTIGGDGDIINWYSFIYNEVKSIKTEYHFSILLPSQIEEFLCVNRIIKNIIK